MDNLTLEHLTPYLPYNLTHHMIFEGQVMIGYIDTYNVMNFIKGITNSKPVMRPLSDLTKEIEHKGKRFVALINLYKWSNEHNYDKELDYEFIDSWVAKGNILKVYHRKDRQEYTEFVFYNLSFRKETIHNKGSNAFGIDFPHPISCDNRIHNNYTLFKKLFEWHFDVFGLIEAGLAIDINTIKK